MDQRLLAAMNPIGELDLYVFTLAAPHLITVGVFSGSFETCVGVGS